MGYGVANVDVEVKLGGSWTSIGSSVMLANGHKIKVKVGMDDAQFTPNGNSCEFTLNNSTREFNPLDAGGVNYGSLTRFTEVRVTEGVNLRFYGYIVSFSPAWNQAGTFSTVTVRCASFSKVRAKDRPLTHMELYTLSQAGDDYPVGYWPCTQPDTSLGSAIGGPPIGVTGTVDSGSLRLRMGTTPGITLTSGATLSVRIPAYAQGALQHNYLRLQIQIPDAGYGGTRTILELQGTGTYRRMIVQYTTSGAGTLGLICYGTAGTALLTTTLLTDCNGSSSPLLIRFSPNTVTPTSLDYLMRHSTSVSGTVTNTSVGAFTSLVIAPNGDLAGTVINHITIGRGPNSQSVFGSVFNAWSTDEEAGARITRVMGYAGGTATIRDAGEKTEWMAMQAPNTMTGIVRDCALADGGMLSDSCTAQDAVEYASLRYLSTDTTLRWALDVSSGHLARTPLPVLDDKDVCNAATASRSGGGEYTYSTVSNIAEAVYHRSLQINCYVESRLLPAAEWAVSLGSALTGRVPSVSTSLARNSSLRFSWYSMRISDRITIANHPDALSVAPLEYFVVGWTEEIGWASWDVDLNVIPTGPFKTGRTGYGRLESEGTVVSAGATSSATSFSVDVTGPGWDSSACPFDMVTPVGERITVTAISGSSSPQTFTVTRGVNGISKSIPTGASLTLFEPYTLAR